MTFTDLPAATARALSGAGPSLVRIGRDPGRGAGFVLADGAVLTSAHNLRGTEVTVHFADGSRRTGSVRGVDPDGDLVVISVDTGGAPPVGWADGPVLGQVVFSPALRPGGGGSRVSVGTVSAVGAGFRGPRGRLITDAFEHTAPVGPGSSGGPVVDAEGRVTGINTHRPGDGFYLAVPATATLRSRVDALARGESPSRRRLGVALAPAHVARRLRSAVGLDPRDGVLVREVAEDSPAAAAGVVRGDLVVRAGAAPVTSVDGLLAAVDAVGADGTLALGVVRANQEIELTVTFPAAGAPAV